MLALAWRHAMPNPLCMLIIPCCCSACTLQAEALGCMQGTATAGTQLLTGPRLQVLGDRLVGHTISLHRPNAAGWFQAVVTSFTPDSGEA